MAENDFNTQVLRAEISNLMTIRRKQLGRPYQTANDIYISDVILDLLLQRVYGSSVDDNPRIDSTGTVHHQVPELRVLTEQELIEKIKEAGLAAVSDKPQGSEPDGEAH